VIHKSALHQTRGTSVQTITRHGWNEALDLVQILDAITGPTVSHVTVESAVKNDGWELFEGDLEVGRARGQ
jgi:hypothetical protein